jgi:hypothetical protein
MGYKLEVPPLHPALAATLFAGFGQSSAEQSLPRIILGWDLFKKTILINVVTLILICVTVAILLFQAQKSRHLPACLR